MTLETGKLGRVVFPHWMFLVFVMTLKTVLLNSHLYMNFIPGYGRKLLFR